LFGAVIREKETVEVQRHSMYIERQSNRAQERGTHTQIQLDNRKEREREREEEKEKRDLSYLQCSLV
jgi:hypothetical protein